jgi:predicted transcriptional regulator YdeE
MPATYTRWTHHGESANATPVDEFSEQVHGNEYDYGLNFQEDEFDHYDRIDVDEEANNDNEEMPDLEMISELYTAAEEDGQQPKFMRVLQYLKWTLCPGSRHSRFSFVVRLLRIKSRYRISNQHSME